MIEKPTKIAKESIRVAGVRCETKESRSEADFKKEENLLALANAASEQRKNLGEPLECCSETGFSRKWRQNQITFIHRG